MTYNLSATAKRDAMSDPDFIAMMQDPSERDSLKLLAMDYGYSQHQVNRASLPRLMDLAAGRKSKARYAA